METFRKVVTCGAVAAVVGSLSACHMSTTWSTPSGIREWGRYQVGELSVAKMKNDREVDDYHDTQKSTDPTSLEALRFKVQEMQNGK